MRKWEELFDQEKQPYYEWVITLIETGCLNIDNEEIEDKAKRMYQVDAGKSKPDPFEGLDIKLDSL